jgi:hypothetical protein
MIQPPCGGRAPGWCAARILLREGEQRLSVHLFPRAFESRVFVAACVPLAVRRGRLPDDPRPLCRHCAPASSAPARPAARPRRARHPVLCDLRTNTSEVGDAPPARTQSARRVPQLWGTQKDQCFPFFTTIRHHSTIPPSPSPFPPIPPHFPPHSLSHSPPHRSPRTTRRHRAPRPKRVICMVRAFTCAAGPITRIVCSSDNVVTAHDNVVTLHDNAKTRRNNDKTTRNNDETAHNNDKTARDNDQTARDKATLFANNDQTRRDNDHTPRENDQTERDHDHSRRLNDVAGQDCAGSWLDVGSARFRVLPWVFACFCLFPHASSWLCADSHRTPPV